MVGGDHLLASLMAGPPSVALDRLQAQGLTRLCLLRFISHGFGADGDPLEQRCEDDGGFFVVTGNSHGATRALLDCGRGESWVRSFKPFFETRRHDATLDDVDSSRPRIDAMQDRPQCFGKLKRLFEERHVARESQRSAFHGGALDERFAQRFAAEVIVADELRSKTDGWLSFMARIESAQDGSEAFVLFTQTGENQ